jgi:hypothetical protein
MRDLSHLPGPDAPDGWPPDPQPELAPILAAKWAETNDDSLRRLTMEDPRLTFSQAGKCAREMSYAVTFRDLRRSIGAGELDDEKHAEMLAQIREQWGPTNPMGESGFWTTGLGRMVHEPWQQMLMARFPDADVEVQSSLEEHGLSCYGRADGVQEDLCIEIKTINGYGFKMIIGARGVAQGPRSGHLAQVCLNAFALNCNRAKLIYLSLECLSPAELKRLARGEGEEWQRFCAEWTIDRVTIEAIANREITRMKAVLERVDKGELAPRSIPDLPKGARITDPRSGAWQVSAEDGAVLDTGNTWQCGYCDFKDRCIADGA